MERISVFSFIQLEHSLDMVFCVSLLSSGMDNLSSSILKSLVFTLSGSMDLINVGSPKRNFS